MLLNVFNRLELIDTQRIDTTILTNNTTTSLARFNPFTEAPVEGVHWRKGTSFGKPASRLAYQTPRTYSFSVGVRF